MRLSCGEDWNVISTIDRFRIEVLNPDEVCFVLSVYGIQYDSKTLFLSTVHKPFSSRLQPSRSGEKINSENDAFALDIFTVEDKNQILLFLSTDFLSFSSSSSENRSLTQIIATPKIPASSLFS